MRAAIRPMIHAALSFLLVVLVGGDASAAPRLAAVFGDGMVLQREQPVRLWGWAEPGEPVTVSFLGHRRTAKADDSGRFTIELPPASAGGPHEIVVQGQTEQRLVDVWVGEVWLAGGQSNMEWPLSRSRDAELEMAEAERADAAIRHFKVQHQAALRPREDVAASRWLRAEPGSGDTVSAVAHFFARSLHRTLGVPIGIVNATWGGTHAETWTPPTAALADPDLAFTMRTLPPDEPTFAARWAKAQQTRIERWQGRPAGAGTDGAEMPAFDDAGWRTLTVPQVWEDQGLEEFDGVVWFRRAFVVGPEQASGPAVLHLGKIDDCDETWVNGQRVGGQCGWDTPRRYTVPVGMLKVGRNVVAVRVSDQGGAGGFHGAQREVRLETRSGEISLDGSWLAQVEAAMPYPGLRANEAPTLAFNGMIHPLVGLPMRGVIWYQGESNVPRAERYAHTFSSLIDAWRAQWHRPDWPFLFVQLAGYDPEHRADLQGSAWAELRDAQQQVLTRPHTGMAVAADVGDPDDIHPREKQTIGERLARLALNRTYGHPAVDTGPVLSGWRRDGRTIVLTFASGDAGPLVVRGGGELRGFTVAGSDHRFAEAQARIEGHEVHVWRDGLVDPVAVRYGWQDDPGAANLANMSGLPASPARTDSWPLRTQGARFGEPAGGR